MVSLKPYWQRRLEGVPVLDDWVLTAGKIEDLWAMPCEVDPTIVVVAGFYELPTLLWSFIKPDAVDQAFDRGYVPSGAGPHRRDRRKKKKRPFVFNAFGAIPGTKIKLGGASAALFPLGQLAQRAGFYFLVIDATLDYLVRWTSTAYQWQGCLPPDFWKKGVTDAANPPGGFVGSNATVAFVGTSSDNPSPHIFSGIAVPAWQDAYIAVDLTLQYGGFLQCTHQVSAWLEQTGTIGGPEIIPPSEVSPGVPVSGSKYFNIKSSPVGRTYNVKVSNHGSPCTCRTNETSTFVGGTKMRTLVTYDPP